MNAVAEIRDIKRYMRQLGEQARAAARVLARADTVTKDSALVAAAAAIRRDAKRLLAANAEDVAGARIFLSGQRKRFWVKIAFAGENSTVGGAA